MQQSTIKQFVIGSAANASFVSTEVDIATVAASNIASVIENANLWSFSC